MMTVVVVMMIGILMMVILMVRHRHSIDIADDNEWEELQPAIDFGSTCHCQAFPYIAIISYIFPSSCDKIQI